MSYMSATAGCDRGQSEAPLYNTQKANIIQIIRALPFPSTGGSYTTKNLNYIDFIILIFKYAKPHRSGALHRHSFEPAIASTHAKSIAYYIQKSKFLN